METHTTQHTCTILVTCGLLLSLFVVIIVAICVLISFRRTEIRLSFCFQCKEQKNSISHVRFAFSLSVPAYKLSACMEINSKRL